MRTTRIMLVAICCLIYGNVAQSATLKDKEPAIFYPTGHYLEGYPKTVGTDIFGYNYQAHKFNGSFANTYLGGDGYPPYWGDTDAYYQAMVEMGYAATVEEAEAMLSAQWYWGNRDIDVGIKWNDAWLSNQDRGDDAGGLVPDGELDRHFGYPTYEGSGAWLTNHRSGTYEVEFNGKIKEAQWTYFIKIITPPTTAVKVDGIWYSADGVEIGPERFGPFAAVQIIGNDHFSDVNGVLYQSPAGSGFGIYGPE